MTNKHIKDGIDVSECKCYSVEEDVCNILSGSCMKEKCQTFRLLQTIQRKEQECDRLKEEVSLLKESNLKLQPIEDVSSLEKCYLQQLDQLKSENETLFKAIEEVNKINKKLKVKNEDLESQLEREKERLEKNDKLAAMLIQDLKNEKSNLVNVYLEKIGQLLSENKELKKRVNELEECENIFFQENKNFRKIYSCLQDIKEIATKMEYGNDFDYDFTWGEQILQKISECEGTND